MNDNRYNPNRNGPYGSQNQQHNGGYYQNQNRSYPSQNQQYSGGYRPSQPQGQQPRKQRSGDMQYRQQYSRPQNPQYQDPRPAAPRNATPSRQRTTPIRSGYSTRRPTYSFNNSSMRQRRRRPTPFLLILIVFAIILLIVIFTSKSFKNMIDSFGKDDTAADSDTTYNGGYVPPETDAQSETETEAITDADTALPPEDTSFLICIDPGHGFGDGGTTSELLGDVTERDINMAVSKKIYDILHSAGYNVVLSHDGVTIPDCPLNDGDALFYIDERVSYANHIRADLFVSIHCDAYPDSDSVYGTRIYYCSENSYSENSAAIVDLLKTSIDNELPDSKDVLTYPKKSSEAFYVTEYTECPSLLIELGFITNKTDAENMLNEAWQDDMAFAIATAISVYVNQNAADE